MKSIALAPLLLLALAACSPSGSGSSETPATQVDAATATPTPAPGEAAAEVPAEKPAKLEATRTAEGSGTTTGPTVIRFNPNTLQLQKPELKLNPGHSLEGLRKIQPAGPGQPGGQLRLNPNVNRQMAPAAPTTNP